MFEHTQVQSYNQIKAPAELKQRVFEACANQETPSAFSWQKATMRLAPLAACLVLLVGVWALNRTEPLLLNVENTPISSEYMMLSANTGDNARIRTASLEPVMYTVKLSPNQEVEVISSQGTITHEDDGSLLWTVEVPGSDTLFELFLQTEDGTYYVPLQYHVNESSFSIRCEKQ